MNYLRIGEVAKRSEVGIETIRYYEREGLVVVYFESENLDGPARSPARMVA